MAERSAAVALEWPREAGTDSTAQLKKRHFLGWVDARKLNDNVGTAAPTAEDRNLAFQSRQYVVLREVAIHCEQETRAGPGTEFFTAHRNTSNSIQREKSAQISTGERVDGAHIAALVDANSLHAWELGKSSRNGVFRGS